MHVMNITDEKGFDIETPLLPDPSAIEIPELDSVFQYALANLPQVKSKEYGVEAMESYVALQKGQRSPRLFARGLIYSNYSDQLINPLDPDPSNPTMDYPTSDQIKDNRYMQASMGLSIPIFNRWQVQTNIKKAKIELQDAEYQYDDAVLVLQKTLQQYYTEALAAIDNYNSALESVANSDEASRFANERFRVGTGTALEMQEARNLLYESTSEMISSKFVLIFYSSILDFYMGRDILF
jgi:outer membrane protein